MAEVDISVPPAPPTPACRCEKSAANPAAATWAGPPEAAGPLADPLLDELVTELDPPADVVPLLRVVVLPPLAAVPELTAPPEPVEPPEMVEPPELEEPPELMGELPVVAGAELGDDGFGDGDGELAGVHVAVAVGVGVGVVGDGVGVHVGVVAADAGPPPRTRVRAVIASTIAARIRQLATESPIDRRFRMITRLAPFLRSGGGLVALSATLLDHLRGAKGGHVNHATVALTLWSCAGADMP